MPFLRYDFKGKGSECPDSSHQMSGIQKLWEAGQIVIFCLAQCSEQYSGMAKSISPHIPLFEYSDITISYIGTELPVLIDKASVANR